MEFKTGTIVKSMSGHDKGSFYAIVGSESGTPLIADGRRRKVEKPKKKNQRHISATNTVIEPAVLNGITNRKLRGVLHPFNFPGEKNANMTDGEGE